MRNGDLFRRCRIIRNLYSVSNQRWFRNASHGNWCRLPCRLFSVHDGERLQIPQRHQGMSVGGCPCSIPEAVRFLLQGQRLQGFRSVYRHKAVRKFIVIAMAVQTSEPTDHQTFLHTTFLFADAWTGVSIAEYPLANRTKMGVLTALNKKRQNPPWGPVCSLI